jgi:hypothetical protein
VSVKGDRESEPNEEFSLNLSEAVAAFIADTQGVGVIQDDDR